jgi:hypothetical protein
MEAAGRARRESRANGHRMAGRRVVRPEKLAINDPGT